METQIDHIARSIVIERVSNAGYNSCISSSPPVDLLVVGPHTFWIKIYTRQLKEDIVGRVVNKVWIDPYDIELMAQWHTKTHIPPLIIFVIFKDNQIENLYIVSLYKLRNKNILTWRGASAKIKDMVLLDDWLATIRESPNKWLAILS